MDLLDYQNYVCKSMSSKYTPELAICGLAGEVGEVADVIKKSIIYDDISQFEAKYGVSVAEKVMDELSDVLYQYTVIANLYGLQIEHIMSYNVEKLNKRHGGAQTAADGGKR